MECGIDVNRWGGQFGTPLGAAAYQGDLKWMEKLLGGGAAVNVTTDSRFCNPIIAA